MRHSTLLLAVMAMLLLVCSSCQDQFAELGEIDRVRYQANYAIPLVDSRVGMREILEDFEENASLTVNPDGLLRFQYSGDVLTRTSLDVFESINETIGNAGIIPIISNRQALPFASPDGLELDRLQMNGTTLTYALVNSYDFPVRVELVLPTVVLDGEPIVVTGELPAYDGNGTPPSINNQLEPLDMSGYTLTPEGDSIYIEYTIQDLAGNDLSPSAGTALLIEDFSFSYAEGYLGNVVYEGGRDTIEIDFFDNWIRGDVYFEEPKITFNFENSFGVPTEAVINVFNIITAEGEILPLESVFLEEGGISFPYPEIDEVGEVKTEQFLFTPENSNIDIVLGSKPVAIDYDVNALTNPDNDTDIRGFITDSSYYRVLVDVDLPLYGQAANFEVRDTFELDFSSYGDIDAIEFKLLTENGLPLAIALQGDFISAEGDTLARLFEEATEVVGGAPVDAEGIPTAPNEVTTFVNWDREQVQRILPAKTLLLTVTFSTTLGLEQSVRVLSEQEAAVKLGAIITVDNE